MKLIIRNKFMALGDTSTVKDENGKDVFKVKGKIRLFSPTKKKKILDMDNNLKFIVRNKFWHFVARSCFLYDEYKQKIGMLTNSDFDFKNTYTLKGYSDDVMIVHKELGFSFDITKNGTVIGHISRDTTFVVDSFVLDVFSEEDTALMVALVIGFDSIRDSRRKN